MEKNMYLPPQATLRIPENGLQRIHISNAIKFVSKEIDPDSIAGQLGVSLVSMKCNVLFIC
jgi:hypothetical protein